MNEPTDSQIDQHFYSVDPTNQLDAVELTEEEIAYKIQQMLACPDSIAKALNQIEDDDTADYSNIIKNIIYCDHHDLQNSYVDLMCEQRNNFTLDRLASSITLHVGVKHSGVIAEILKNKFRSMLDE